MCFFRIQIFLQISRSVCTRCCWCHKNTHAPPYSPCRSLWLRHMVIGICAGYCFIGGSNLSGTDDSNNFYEFLLFSELVSLHENGLDMSKLISFWCWMNRRCRSVVTCTWKSDMLKFGEIHTNEMTPFVILCEIEQGHWSSMHVRQFQDDNSMCASHPKSCL